MLRLRLAGGARRDFPPRLPRCRGRKQVPLPPRRPPHSLFPVPFFKNWYHTILAEGQWHLPVALTGISRVTGDAGGAFPREKRRAEAGASWLGLRPAGGRQLCPAGALWRDLDFRGITAAAGRRAACGRTSLEGTGAREGARAATRPGLRAERSTSRSRRGQVCAAPGCWRHLGLGLCALSHGELSGR